MRRSTGWALGSRRSRRALARRHLSDGTLVLYDVSSSHVEGRCCELARFGHPRNGRRDKMQIVFGLLCSPEGCPIAIEVFEGNTGDPATLGDQIAKLKERFGLKRVVMVGDRGMITQARIQIAGAEMARQRLASARGRQGALDSGDLKPSHLKGRKPEAPSAGLQAASSAFLAA